MSEVFGPSTRTSTSHPPSGSHRIPRTPPATSRVHTVPLSPSASANVVFTAGLRRQVAQMREGGRGALPPTIEYDYISSSPAPDKGKGKGKGKEMARATTRVLSSSDTEPCGDRGGDEDEPMAIDGQSDQEVPARSTTQSVAVTDYEGAEDDPHSIDDLYGEVAPRFRDKPTPPVTAAASASVPVHDKARPRAPAVARLPMKERSETAVRDDDIGHIYEKIERIEEVQWGDPSRRPRKGAATKLVGRKLRKKQEKMLNYCEWDNTLSLDGG